MIDKLIKYRIKLDQEGMNKYNEETIIYTHKLKIYEDDLRNYLQQKPQNTKDVEQYEDKLKIYHTKKNKYITQQTKIICQEYGINYDGSKG